MMHWKKWIEYWNKGVIICNQEEEIHTEALYHHPLSCKKRTMWESRKEQSENMRTTRLRQKIKKFLDERGEANTTEILEHVNSTMRHGTTPQQLGNVLSKDKDILKVATTKRGGALSGRYEICVWQVRPGALDGKAQISSSSFQSPLRAKLFIFAL